MQYPSSRGFYGANQHDTIEQSRSMDEDLVRSSSNHGNHQVLRSVKSVDGGYCLDRIPDSFCASLCQSDSTSNHQERDQSNLDDDVGLNKGHDLRLNVEKKASLTDVRTRYEENEGIAFAAKRGNSESNQNEANYMSNVDQVEGTVNSANTDSGGTGYNTCELSTAYEEVNTTDAGGGTGYNSYESPKNYEEPETADAGCLFCPKITPIPACSFILLTICAAIPAALYIALFTKIGYGLQVFSFIDEKMKPIGVYLGEGVFVYAVILYFIDVRYWKSYTTIVLRRHLLFILFAWLLLLVICIADDHPYGPVGIILIVTTFWMISIRFVFFRNVEKREYISWLSGPILLVSLVVALYWIVWTSLKEENEWTLINALLDADKAGCEPNFETYPQCDDGKGNVCFEIDEKDYKIRYDKDCEEACRKVYDTCPNTFIIWAGPFLVSLGFFFLSFFASFLRGDGSTEQSVGKLAKIWMFLLFGIWVSSSLAGAGAGVSAALAALTLAAFVASAIFLVAGYDRFERDEQASSIWTNIKEKYASALDPARGLLIVTCTPIAACYIVVSIFKQLIRNCNRLYTKPQNPASLRNVTGAGWLTVECRRLVRTVLSWNFAKVFTYAIYWGIAFMTMNVIIAEFTIVFLSWLIEETADMNIAAVTGILAGVGLTMFLLPPVPGVPIYLTLGIVIIPVGKELLGITGSIIYAMIVSLILKMLACTLQQKIIGGQLQHMVSVRQFVGINSKVIRAMKLVLLQKGLGVAKVTILIGGPDWPTSVLCGIMDLPLIPILVGTLPIIFLILPTLLTGSFTYMASMTTDEGQQEYPWATTLATVFLAITSFVQFGSMIVAAFYIENTVTTRGKELEEIPIDQEVKEADDKLDQMNKAYEEATKWERLPIVLKGFLCLSLACMILCCYMVQLFADDCFAEYQLTYTIDENLDGDWKKIVLPLGRVALLLFLISIVLLQVFRISAGSLARKIVAN